MFSSFLSAKELRITITKAEKQVYVKGGSLIKEVSQKKCFNL